MSFAEAWAAYASGDFERAARLFEKSVDEDWPSAMVGMARSFSSLGDHETAQDLAARLNDFESTPVTVAVMGEVVGALGQRKAAEEILEVAAQQAPNDALIRVVLGEQRIRRGKWDVGASDFIAGLSANGRRDLAVIHTQHVLADLIEALIQGKIREDDANKFINRIDYNISAKTNRMAQVFGAARRSIANRTPMQLGFETAVTQQEQAVSGPPPRPGPPESRPPKQPPRSQASQKQPSAAPPRRPPMPSGNSELLKLMQRDRETNEKLQQDVVPVGLPDWPSRLQTLDTLPSTPPSLLNITHEEIRGDHVHFSGGNIASEIAIRRGLDLVLSRASALSSFPPEITPGGLARLELLCWDGLLDSIEDLPDEYQPPDSDVPARLLGLGAFVGSIVANRQDAAWRFEKNPKDSQVLLPDGNFNPFDLVTRWMAAQDVDEVDLVEPVRKLNPDVVERSWLDPTEGLTDRALVLRLAELWNAYRWDQKGTLAEMADTIEVVAELPAAVIFAIDHGFAPPIARGPKNAAMVGKRVMIAYLRASGDFVLMASRKHIARLLKVVYPTLTPEVSTGVVKLVCATYRPAGKLVETGGESDRPHMVKFNNGAIGVRFVIRSSMGEERLQLVWTPGRFQPWHLGAQ